jgi:hypothetical protein
LPVQPRKKRRKGGWDTGRKGRRRERRERKNRKYKEKEKKKKMKVLLRGSQKIFHRNGI